MTSIMVIGSENDTAAERLIKSELSKTYEVTYIKGGSVERRGGGYGLLFFDSPAPRVLGISSPLFLAKKTAPIEAPLQSGTAIINADFPPQIRAVRKSGINAVTCGFSPTATISFSSESDDRLVVSLNRSLTAMSGRTIQPLEIPIRKNGADSYALMSVTALRLLLDDFDSELGELI